LLARRDHREVAPVPAPEAAGPPRAFDAILELLARRYHLDLRAYKTGTLQRRTERRMGLAQAAGWQEYLHRLESDPEELAALYDDLLIGVTRFFRDGETWEYVASEVIPALLDRRVAEEAATIRIWVPGCASGEEVYTLAMLFIEEMERRHLSLRLQVYATDVNPAALATGRQGAYPGTIADEVGPERLNRFFRRDGEGFQVLRRVRDVVTFALHDVMSDPPFSRLDMVSCRNLLIYLEPSAQERVFDMLHFALNPGGALLLGSSETADKAAELFEVWSKTHRVYRSTTMASMRRTRIPAWLGERGPGVRAQAALVAPAAPGPRVDRLVEQRVVSRYAAASVAVNTSQHILYLFGPTEDYLQQPSGEARLDLLSWVRPGLYTKLRQGLRSAIDGKQATTVSDARMERDGASVQVEVTIEPVAGAEGVFLVVFRDVPPPPAARLDSAARPQASDEVARQLEEELRGTRTELQSTVEQLESVNEEFRANHEELLSLNEELQSSNEELETSKEELQSLNEELATINRQLEEKNKELREVNADLRNLLSSTEIPTIFLDRHLSVRQYTPAATQVMRLVPSDVGRSIEHIKERLRDDRLVSDANLVLERLAPATAELQMEDGRWFVRRIMPYRSDDDRIDGVCVTFNDVTAQKAVAAAADRARRFAEATVRTIRMPLLVLDPALRIVAANEGFHRAFALGESEVLSRRIYELGPQWDNPAMQRLLEKILPERRSVEGFELELDAPNLPRRVLLDANVMSDDGRPAFILVAFADVTQRREDERAAVDAKDELAREYRRKDEFLAMLGHELRNPLSALSNGLELLRRVEGDRERSAHARDMMIRQAKRISAMLDQLLDVARVVSGRVQIARELVDLTDVARAAVEVVTPLVDSKRLDLAVALPPRAMVTGDAVRLTQVLENLLTNAAKYTDEGGHIWLTITAEGNSARVVVKDTGVGMDADLLPHVFELFTQERRTLDRSKGGLGLGLPLVRRLTEMHGGTVEGSSPGLGRGSEFVVTLPLIPVRTLDERSERAEAPAPAVPVRPRRILLVDDEEDSRCAMAEILVSDGHQVEAVGDGPAALIAARRFRPEVVLLDLGLPGMDGYEVARRLRDEHGPALRLIAMTGYRRDGERVDAAGFDEHLLKPADLGTLAAALAGPGSGAPAAGP
jgi:two-component system, chemotaxis family, CheB/CheR fusion protein